MKNITQFLKLVLFFSLSYSLNAQIKIEYNPTGLAGNANYQAVAPFSPSKYYSYAQTIYLASEINASGDITSLSWNLYGGGIGLPNSQDLTVYIGTTTKSSFTSLTDWIPVANMTQVYHGGIVAESLGWIKITLDTPFHYDNGSNLVIAVNEKHDGFDSSAYLYNSAVPTVRSLCYGGETLADENNPPTSSSRTFLRSSIANVIIEGLTKNCPLPESVTFSDITTSTAKIIWDNTAAGAGASTDYYYTTSSTIPDINTFPSGNVSDKNYTTINSLDANTAYYVWLRNVCGDHESQSSWKGPLIVNTECNAVSDFTENFDNLVTADIPTCWTRILRSAAASKSSIGAISNNFTDGSIKSMLLKNDGSNLTNDDVILAMPKTNTLQSGTYRLRFYAKSGSNDPQNGSIQVGTVNNVTSKAVFTKFEDINLSPAAQEYYVDFTDYITTDTYLAIRMTTTGVFGGVYIDNVIWEVTPPCEDVKNIAIPTTTATTAKVTWSTELDTYYELALGSATDTDPSKLTPKEVSLGVKNFDLDQLTASTIYNVWVRTVCQGSVYGKWIGPVSFMTPCDGSLDTLIENFDKNTFVVPSLPPCWTKILRGPTNSNFTDITTASDNAHSGTDAIKIYDATATGSNDVILVSPAITNLYDSNKQVIFYAKIGPNGNTAKLQVGTLKSNSPDASFYALVGNEFSLTKNYQKIIVDLSIIPGSDNYLGFRVNSDTNTTIYVDDVSFDLKSNDTPDLDHLASKDFNQQEFKTYPNPVKDILNIEYLDVINVVSVYDILGQEVISKRFDSANVNLNMSLLDKGVYLVKTISNEKVNFVRIVKE